jgi:hypothetical protein
MVSKHIMAGVWGGKKPTNQTNKQKTSSHSQEGKEERKKPGYHNLLQDITPMTKALPIWPHFLEVLLLPSDLLLGIKPLTRFP